MKQVILLLFGASIFVTSCRKDEEAVPDKEWIAASWRITAQQKISGKDSSILESIDVEGCDAQQEYLFTDDGKFTFTNYQQTSNGCQHDPDRDIHGEYVYDEASKRITLDFGDYAELIKVPVLTRSEMHFKRNDTDFDDDGIADYILLIFKR